MRIKSPATWLFIQQFDQDYNKENQSSALCVGIPLAKASDAESDIMCHDIITLVANLPVYITNAVFRLSRKR